MSGAIFSKTLDRLGKTGIKIFGGFKQNIAGLSKDTHGNIAIMTAVLLPALVAVAGVAIDYSSTYSSVSKLQQAADNSALASARELSLANVDTVSIQAVAANHVAANLSSSKGFFTTAPTVQTKVDLETGTVAIAITASKKNAFGGFLQPEITTLNVSAVARSLGGSSSKICVIILEPSFHTAFGLGQESSLNAVDCTVQVNSTDGYSMELGWNSV